MGNSVIKILGNKSTERAQDENLSKFLDRMNRQEQDVLRLLLLGAGDSGKTTILKQMHILYGNGISRAQKLQAKKPLFRELVLGAKATLEAAEEVPEPVQIRDEETLRAAYIIREYDVEDQEDELPDEIARGKLVREMRSAFSALLKQLRGSGRILTLEEYGTKDRIIRFLIAGDSLHPDVRNTRDGVVQIGYHLNASTFSRE